MNTTDIVDNNDNNNKSFSLYPILARNKFTAELGKRSSNLQIRNGNNFEMA